MKYFSFLIIFIFVFVFASSTQAAKLAPNSTPINNGTVVENPPLQPIPVGVGANISGNIQSNQNAVELNQQKPENENLSPQLATDKNNSILFSRASLVILILVLLGFLLLLVYLFGVKGKN